MTTTGNIIDPDIFKAYDVRGVYGQVLSVDVPYIVSFKDVRINYIACRSHLTLIPLIKTGRETCHRLRGGRKCRPSFLRVERDQPATEGHPGTDVAVLDLGPLGQSLVAAIHMQADRLFLAVEAANGTPAIRCVSYQRSTFE